MSLDRPDFPDGCAIIIGRSGSRDRRSRRRYGTKAQVISILGARD
jgi:hypothetical protein